MSDTSEADVLAGQAATLAALLVTHANGHSDTDEIPQIVRDVLAHGPVDADAAVAAMNAAADAINDGHEYEHSGSIQADDRANLFTNVAGYMLDNDTAGMDDAAIVDAAITASYADSEMQCEAGGCGEYVDTTARHLAGYADPADTRKHLTGRHHIPLSGPLAELRAGDLRALHAMQHPGKYAHAFGEHDHEPVITGEGQAAALIARVREWSG